MGPGSACQTCFGWVDWPMRQPTCLVKTHAGILPLHPQLTTTSTT